MFGLGLNITMRYKENLHIEGDKVVSYVTHVATIDRDAGVLHVHGYWSVTTSKHVNHVARELGLALVKDSDKKELKHKQGQKEEREKEGLNRLKSVGMVAILPATVIRIS